MLRTDAVRQTRDELHKAEAAMQKAMEDARLAHQRLIAAKKDLGLTGSMGDRAIARWGESVETMEQAWELMVEGHQEAYAVLKYTNLRHVAGPGTWETELNTSVEAPRAVA